MELICIHFILGGRRSWEDPSRFEKRQQKILPGQVDKKILPGQVDKLTELEQDVMDDKFLFYEGELTERVRREGEMTEIKIFNLPNININLI